MRKWKYSAWFTLPQILQAESGEPLCEGNLREELCRPSLEVGLGAGVQPSPSHFSVSFLKALTEQDDGTCLQMESGQVETIPHPTTAVVCPWFPVSAEVENRTALFQDGGLYVIRPVSLQAGMSV